jgi:hypothetical protein
MSRIRGLLVVALIFGLAPAPLCAQAAEAGLSQANLDALLSAMRANRKAFVAINLQLSETEAAKFWPVYDRYQQDVNAVGDRLVALIEDYTKNFASLSDEKATQIVKDYLAIEADRVKVRSSYVDEFAKALSGRKLARLYQIENKMDAVIRYDLAATIPVMEQ